MAKLGSSFIVLFGQSVVKLIVFEDAEDLLPKKFDAP
jgi:hypothetical protein